MRKMLMVLAVLGLAGMAEAQDATATPRRAKLAPTKPPACATSIVVGNDGTSTVSATFEKFAWSQQSCVMPTGPLYWFVMRCVDTTDQFGYSCVSYPHTTTSDPMRITFQPVDDGLYQIVGMWYSAGLTTTNYYRVTH